VIAVVDYGVNNLRSVVRALEAAGAEGTLTTDPAVVARADRVVVPGVGHFDSAMRTLTRTGLGDAIQSVAAAGRPVLGICLGLQVCCAASEEAPGLPGLSLLPGRVIRFRTTLPVPHVGWAEVTGTSAGSAHPVVGSLLRNGPVFYYHVHSYHPADVPEPSVLAVADYEGSFPTIIGSGNVLGAQFHPEKSQQAGVELLRAFTQWAP
jgi:imidazole glycerol phosphate synthase glutamine amidotransferase subunit